MNHNYINDKCSICGLMRTTNVVGFEGHLFYLDKNNIWTIEPYCRIIFEIIMRQIME